MKFRLGFISNSSSSSYIVTFPKGVEKNIICKANLRLSNPPAVTLTEASRYEDLRELIEGFLKELKIVSKTDEETVYEISIPIKILATYEDLIEEVGYWVDNADKYRPQFKNHDFGLIKVSNEDDILAILIYFLGLRFFDIHPMIQITEERLCY